MDLFSCKCTQIKRESYVSVGLKYSDIIFLGELIDSTSTDHSYSFKILEIFKGNYKNKIIKGLATNSCSLRPTDKGLWLIYASFEKDSLIDIGMCGPSVSLKNPDGLYYPLSIRFGKESKVEQLERRIEYLNKKIDGLSNWYYDLASTKAKSDFEVKEVVSGLLEGKKNLTELQKAKIFYE